VLLTVLGCAAGGVPGPGGAGSGYLVQEGDTSLVMDCGNGVLGHLARHLPPQRVDAVYLSHLHPDHFADLYPFLLQRTRFGSLPVHAPPGARGKLEAWVKLLSSHPDVQLRMLDVQEYESGTSFRVGKLKVEPREVSHNVPSFGCRITAGGATLAYSSDTRRCDALLEVAREARLFLCEATLQEGVGDAEFVRHQLQSHLSARLAGEVAAKADARSLMLTHMMYYLDPAESVRQAQEGCLCPVRAAREHLQVSV